MSPPAPPDAPNVTDAGLEALEAAEECAAGLNFGIVAVVAVFALIIGFLIGTRAKQIVQAAKASAKAVLSIRELLKAGAADKNDDGEAEAAGEDDEEEEQEPQELLEGFMNSDQINGMDDHPDIVRNPILLYHVKLSKDEARREKRKLALIAEGMDEEDAEQMLRDEAAGGMISGGGGEGKQNALATLIAAGARVTAVTGGQSNEAALADERRRTARTIEVFLEKNRGIDTSKTAMKKSNGGKRMENALDVAVKSKSTSIGGPDAQRHSEKIQMARTGRQLLRGIHTRREKAGLNVIQSSEGDGAAFVTDDQAAELAEIALEEGEEGGEEGDDLADEGNADDADNAEPLGA